MGQEARCACDWNGATVEVKAILEPPALILRGGLRKRLLFASLEKVRADGDRLCFRFEGEEVALAVGKTQAEAWAKALTAPPPSLAKKLGIRPETVVRTFGEMDARELREALMTAQAVREDGADLMVARVNSPRELERALREIAKELHSGVPVWFVYPKGKGQALSETDVRSTALATGIVDTKVAAISATLTGLRFVKRRSE
jgi:hypothetical protein